MGTSDTPLLSGLPSSAEIRARMMSLAAERRALAGLLRIAREAEAARQARSEAEAAAARRQREAAR